MPKRDPGPSVKDKELYEKLRDEGSSKEKSARIANAAANTSRRSVGRKGGKAGDYDDWAAQGASGWDWRSVLPYFKRAEHNERGANAWHGAGGQVRLPMPPAK